MHDVSGLVDKLGGPSIVAEKCGVSVSAVCNWSKRGIAAEHRLTLWRMATAAGLDWTPPGAEGLALVLRQPERAA